MARLVIFPIQTAWPASKHLQRSLIEVGLGGFFQEFFR